MRLRLTVISIGVAIITMATQVPGQNVSERPRFCFPAQLSEQCFKRPLRKVKGTIWKPIYQNRIIVGTCTANVGTCPSKTCPFHQSDKLRWVCDGYVCPTTRTKTVDCGVYGSFDVKVVTACGCCRDEGIVLNGVVFDSNNREPLPKIKVTAQYEKSTLRTDKNGSFSTTVTSRITRYALKISDPTDQYVETVKVVERPTGFRRTIDVEIALVRRANPIYLNPALESNITFSEDVNIVLSAHSYFNADNTPHTDTVLASMTLIDTSVENANSTSQIPGQLLTVGNGKETHGLMTNGMFELTLTDMQGNRLRNDLVTVRVKKNMKLWSLSYAGYWILLPVISSGPRRSKRQDTGFTAAFVVQILTGNWISVDKLSDVPYCYFKARIFDEVDGIEITTSNSASFGPRVLLYISSAMQILWFYFNPTYSPSLTCHEVRCSDPSILLSGFINMTSYESVIIGGVSIPVITSLSPVPYQDYSNTIQGAFYTVLYTAPTNGINNAYVNFISNFNGPFYNNKKDCENSTVAEPAFHFTKPRLPSYEPYPEDTDICTARVNFTDSYNFFTALSNLDALPNITAVSAWNQDDIGYFYTSTTKLQLSSNDGMFFFTCLQYRCSKLNESTTVYIDIEAPLINPNNTSNSGNKTVPVFICYGICNGDLCDNSNMAPSGISGSFVPPVNVSDGPAYFFREVYSCKDRTKMESFAFTLECYSMYPNWNNSTK